MPSPDYMDRRFWCHVDRSGECWIWTAGKTTAGYGHTAHIDGKQRYAHRVAYEQVVGPIPEGLELDHLCRNPTCVNPEHLEAVTHRENIRRGYAALRTHCPRGHPYTDDNLVNLKSGLRRCRICHSAQETERVKRQRAEIRNAPRFCACGCGTSISGRKMDTKWATQACRRRASNSV